MKMWRILLTLFAWAASLFLAMPAFAQAQGDGHPTAPSGPPPLKLVGTFEFPSDEGIFDHLLADIPGHRLFTTPRGHKSVKVFDLQTRKLNRVRVRFSRIPTS